MAENLDLDVSELYIPKPKKSKLLVIDGTEEAQELHVDFDYHPKRQIQHDPPPFDIHAFPPLVQETNDEDALVLEIPPLEQYIHLLVEEMRVWKLAETDLIIISDYRYHKGRIILRKNLLVVNKKYCVSCSGKQCLHFQATILCNQPFEVCEPCTVNHSTYFLLTTNTIFFLDTEYHFYINKERKWFCDTCTGICKQKHKFLPILTTFDLPVKKAKNAIKYSTVSTFPIPVTLNESKAQVYNQQLTHGIDLPQNIYPEVEYCVNGYPFAKVLEQTGIIIYTETDVLKLNEHRIFSSRCCGPCICKAVFEGSELLLLNLNNRYLIHYGVLFDYSELMTLSRNTLHGYMRAKNMKMQRMGRENRYSYHILQHAWNAYLRMVNIDYTSVFTCTVCKDNPDVVILDGITLGTSRDIPEAHFDYDKNQQYLPIPLSQRVFVPNILARKMLNEYTLNSLFPNRFTELVDLLTNELADYLRYSCIYEENIVKICQEFPNVKVITRLLSRSEPITGIFQFSLLTSDEQHALVQLSMGDPVDHVVISSICRKMSSLAILFNSFETIELTGGELTLHSTIARLLGSIMLKVKSLYGNPTRVAIEVEEPNDNYFAYFPGFKSKYMIPVYHATAKGESVDNCTKLYPKHQRLSPGLLVMVCKHKICYGFQILREKESTVAVFNLILRYFRIPPRTIIYDNACNLHNTCMIRDPKLFKKTTFLIDRFHSRNHRCNYSYTMKSIKTESFRDLNSQACEQLFSTLRRISPQVSFMRIENVYYNVRYFLSCLNTQELLKIQNT